MQQNSHQRSQSSSARARRDMVVIFCVCLVVFLIAAYIDAFELFIHWYLRHVDFAQLDELIIVVILLPLGLIAFSYRRWHEYERELQERVKAEQSFAQQLYFLQTLIDTIPNPIFYKDADGKYLGCNKAFEEFAQRKSSDIVGKTVFDMGSREIAQTYYDKDRELFDHPGVQRYEWRMQGREGHVREVMFDKATYTDVDGNVAGLLGVITDITERKQMERALRDAETKYRSLVEESLTGVYMIQAGRFMYLNPRLAEIFGYSVDELPAGTPVEALVAPESRSTVAEKVRQRMAGEVKSAHYSFKGLRKNGTVFDVEALGTATNYGGQPVIIGSLLDITDRKRLEAEIVRTQKLESLGVLAGGIAHDFNNLLTAILGNISLAALQIPSGDVSHARMEEAEKAAIKARDLAQQLLTFAKGGAPVKKTLSLRQVVADTSSFSTRGSKVRCEYAFPDSLWPVEADEGQISQVVNNLVINACQAMQGGGIIRLSAENLSLDHDENGLPAGRYVLLKVSDTGVGISEAHRQKIFDPYFTTKEGGSGLGLATSYSIVRRHGGAMTVESAIGRGATFLIYLPAAPEMQPEQDLRSPSWRPEELNPGMRVLLMDDEEQIRQMGLEALAYYGYDVEAAVDGAEAFERYRKAMTSGRPFDLVITDLTVPGGMGGKELIEALQEIDPAVCAIVSSGYANDPIVAEHEKHGFRGVVVKPYRIKELGDAIARALGLCSGDSAKKQ